MKNILLALCIIPAIMQAQPLTIKGGKMFTDSELLFKDSLNLYFKPVAGADSVLRVPLSLVTSRVDEIPSLQYESLTAAIYAQNLASGKAVNTQMYGALLTVLGMAAVGVSVAADVPGIAYGGAVISIGGFIAWIAGIAMESSSHTGLRQMGQREHSIQYRF